MNPFIHKDIYVVRHGETDWNRQGKIQGHTDIPLNAEGKQQALQLKEKLTHIDFTRVFSSDLSRAHQTAMIILNDRTINIVQSSALRERTAGIWEGRSINELREQLKQDTTLVHLPQDKFMSYKFHKDSESYVDVHKRITHFITSIMPIPTDGPILLASHGSVLRALLYNAEFKPGFRWHVKNLACIKFGLTKEGKIHVLEIEDAELVPEDRARFPI